MLSAFFDFLASIGLGHPATRAVAAGAAGFGTQYLFKPSISYVNISNGKTKKSAPREFKLSSSSPQATWFPWYFWPLLFAIIAGVFI